MNHVIIAFPSHVWHFNLCACVFCSNNTLYKVQVEMPDNSVQEVHLDFEMYSKLDQNGKIICHHL